MLINYTTQQPTDIYKLMSGNIIPRPIAWIVTKSKDDVLNIAPFSYFTGLSSNPPTILVSIGHKSDGTPKDTLKNIRETKKATVCLVDEKSLEKMHFSSKELDEKTSEADVFKIETKEMIEDFPPMVEGVGCAFFCKFYSEVELKGSKTIPLVLEIKHQYLAENSSTPTARVGKSYAKVGEEIEAPKIP